MVAARQRTERLLPHDIWMRLTRSLPCIIFELLALSANLRIRVP